MDGILVINKPKGFTSHDVVALIRNRFAFKKVGHAGTLDPMATGVLVVLIGACTKSSQVFLSEDKDYEGTLVLGAVSDTGDAWGRITPSGKNTDFSAAEIEKVFGKFLGQIEQVPPMYSAVKVKGKKLYELARKGLTVKVAPRTVFIKTLAITGVSLPEVSFNITCSKGTYVRKLAADIGDALGCGAYLSRLNRTRSGRFTIDQAIDIEELKNFKNTDLAKRLLVADNYDSHKRIESA